MLYIFLFLSAIFVTFCNGKLEDDLVPNVPGLIFQNNFKTYSGYLNGGKNGQWKMHYMLTESRNDPDKDPLLFWFNGGPGCSSFSGSFEELGPFYINSDGKTLFENVYSWNARANVLYLESPIGTGFSYDTTNANYSDANDDQTRDQNYNALLDFFNNVAPKYKGKDFYLSGESYAGIYLPMLGAKIAQNLATFPANLKGIAIGNGFMNVKMLTNSLILWSNYHGRFSIDEWQTLKYSCCTITDKDNCDWTKYLVSSNNIDYTGDSSTCGKLLTPVINATGYFNIDPYNYYEDCYSGSHITYKKFGKPQRHYYQKWKQSQDDASVNTADLLNRDSTDNLLGYPCYQEDYVAKYFNDPAVQDAYHIDPAWRKAGKVFGDCNADIYNNYKLTYDDMAPYFDIMIKNFSNVRILVYNGDVDTVCNFLGDAKFIDGVASNHNMNVSIPRQRWYYRDNVAGFYQRYSGGNNFQIDVLTVKGAGHMVPMDRPGPSVQMISNFVLSPTPDYSSSQFVDPTVKPAPLLNNPNTTPSPVTFSDSPVTSNTTFNTTTTSPATITTGNLTTTTTSNAGKIIFSLPLLILSILLL